MFHTCLSRITTTLVSMGYFGMGVGWGAKLPQALWDETGLQSDLLWAKVRLHHSDPDPEV